MIGLVKRGIVPASIQCQNEAAALLTRKRECGGFDCSLEEHMLTRLSGLSGELLKRLTRLEEAVLHAEAEQDLFINSEFYRDAVNPAMNDLRQTVDELETLTAGKHWPLPAYAELLYSVI
jgi:glutamine synthetase